MLQAFSFAKRLPYIRTIFEIFLAWSILQIKDFEGKGIPEFSKSRQKQGIDLRPLQIFQTMCRMFYFRLGIGNSVKRFQRKVIVPRYLRIGNKNSLNFKGIQFSMQFKNSLQESRRIF